MNFFRQVKTKLNNVVNYIESDNIVRPMSLVQEIHASFENEIHSILEDLSIRKELETANEQLQTKCDQLKSLGFINTPEVLAIEQLKEENELKIKENKKKQEAHEDIMYFQQKYPLYKIITIDSLNKLCQKYQLGYAAISGFIGVVPQKNLDAMLEFKIDELDKALLDHSNTWNDKAPTKEQKVDAYRSLKFIDYSNYRYKSGNKKDCALFSPLIIAAPPSDFTNDYQKNKFGKLEPIKKLEDPIVMQPVEHNNNIYALIITAWGPEASDPDVVNQVMN